MAEVAWRAGNRQIAHVSWMVWQETPCSHVMWKHTYICTHMHTYAHALTCMATYLGHTCPRCRAPTRVPRATSRPRRLPPSAWLQAGRHQGGGDRGGGNGEGAGMLGTLVAAAQRRWITGACCTGSAGSERPVGETIRGPHPNPCLLHPSMPGPLVSFSQGKPCTCQWAQLRGPPCSARDFSLDMIRKVQWQSCASSPEKLEEAFQEPLV